MTKTKTKANTKTVEKGNTVSVHYKGTFDDGTEFDSSYTRDEPISFTVGSGQMIQGFDDAVVGMFTGDTKTITLEPEDAYGEADPERTTEMPSSAFPADFDLSQGANVPLMGPGGQHMLGTVKENTAGTVLIDLNHPMAGKDLTFEINLVNIDT